MAGTSWLDEQLRLIEYWRERRTAFLAAQPAAVVLPLSGRGLLRLVAPARPRPVARAGRELAQATRAKVLSVLEEESGNRSAAARRLGIQISTLSRMLKRWGGEPGIREGAA
jgi:transcriptional regulator of acetoin/glycerol metabolism